MLRSVKSYEPTVQTVDRPPALWLAFYAMGLASAGRGGGLDVVEELADAAGRDVRRLIAAERLLTELDVVDEDVRSRARAMLGSALGRPAPALEAAHV